MNHTIKLNGDNYVERDLSWMYFNHRILLEAMNPHVPLLERVSFLGIYSNNLDEFFRVRMATLGRIAECTDKSLQRESCNARELIERINKLNNRYARQYEQAVHQVEEGLEQEQVCLRDEQGLDADGQRFVCDYFYSVLSGFVSPIWLSSVKQLTDDPDDSIYLAVKMRATGRKHIEYALIPLPVAECGRFVQLPRHDSQAVLMYLDDVIRFCLPMIFNGTGFCDFEAYSFKFTKDAEMEIDNDLRNGMLQKISKGVKSRRKGNALRVIYDGKMPHDLLKRVMGKLNLDKLDTVLKGGRYHNHKDLMRLPSCGRNDLKYPVWTPLHVPALQEAESMLLAIQQSDRFLHVPYHSFDHYIRLLQEAAISKEVKSIKTTLYRLAKDSKVVKALMCAARNGKKVTVVIELLARFDEASNIGWSKKMQDQGVHVVFGVEGLKVHSKITHIGMKSGPDIAVVSTGNFHEGNARAYTDVLLFTAARPIVADVRKVFSFIEKPYTPVRFTELLVSPNEMRRKFIKLINNEIENHKAGKPAYIRIKINHITDTQMVEKLYEASAAGVEVDLLVRGNCSLVTGINGTSDHIHIRGIIDRYLEHARIFIFAAGGEEKVFMGSADWMPRNLDNRVEVVTPVYDPYIKEELRRIVDDGLADTAKAYVVDGTGRNHPAAPYGNEAPFRSQEQLYNHYQALLQADAGQPQPQQSPTHDHA